MRPLALTIHAWRQVAERELDMEWIERTAREPDWQQTDPDDPSVDRRYRAIPEYGNRVLRVVVLESPEEIRILTAFFDRKARRP